MSSVAQLKTPPNSVEAESALLGAMIEANWLINEIEGLRATDFYRRENQLIYTCLQMLATAGRPVDPVTLVNALEATNNLDAVGGMDYIADLAMESRGHHNAKDYAKLVIERSLSRKLIQIGQQIASSAYESGEIQDKIEQAQKLVMDIEVAKSDEPRHINAVLQDSITEIERLFNQGGGMIGIPTGFTDIDSRMSGLQEEDLVIIAGRPGMGKSVLAMNIAENVIQQGKFVLVFSLEMSDTQLNMRSISSVGRVAYNQLKRGAVDDQWAAITAGVAKLKDRQMYIDDNANLSSSQIVSRARKVAQKTGKKVDVIVVDYLQLLNDKGEGHERITKISRAMKLAAKELKCTVILLSQLNRKCEERSDKRPQLADLRESGSIEQDADAIIMLYRDEVYNEHSNQKGVAEAIVRKLRNGEPGTVFLRSELGFMRFSNLENYTPPPMEKKRGGPGFAYLDN